VYSAGSENSFAPWKDQHEKNNFLNKKKSPSNLIHDRNIYLINHLLLNLKSMKKQITILATVFATVAIVSCSKEKMNGQGSEQRQEELTTASVATSRTITDPLTVNLEGFFKFNKNLKDVTGKLKDGYQQPLTRTGVAYTTDRFGIANAALKFDGSYWVNLPDVPQQTNTSVSVWIKRTDLFSDIVIVSPNGKGPRVDQNNYVFRGLMQTGWLTPDVYSTPFMGSGWHHVVVTFDGNDLKLYVDAVYQGSMHNPFTFSKELVYYAIGGMDMEGNIWKGCMDDLRFYSRTLSSKDVLALYNQ